MKIEYINQGIGKKDSLERRFKKEIKPAECRRYLFFVAFMTTNGLNKILNELKEISKKGNASKIFVGLDLGITNAITLQKLYDNKLETYIVQSDENFIYHPKLYIFEYDTYFNIYLGSFNLTTSGIAGNIEAGIKITLSKLSKADKKFIDNLLHEYQTLIDGSSAQIKLLTKTFLDDFLKLISSTKISRSKVTYKKAQKTINKKIQELFNQSEEWYSLWAFTGQMTSGSKNQFEPSKTSVSIDTNGNKTHRHGSINFFLSMLGHASSIKSFSINIIYKTNLYVGNKVEDRKGNDNWRINLNGTNTITGRLDHNVANFVNKILLFGYNKKKNVFTLEIFDQKHLNEFKKYSEWHSKNGKGGRGKSMGNIRRENIMFRCL